MMPGSRQRRDDYSHERHYTQLMAEKCNRRSNEGHERCYAGKPGLGLVLSPPTSSAVIFRTSTSAGRLRLSVNHARWWSSDQPRTDGAAGDGGRTSNHRRSAETTVGSSGVPSTENKPS